MKIDANDITETIGCTLLLSGVWNIYGFWWAATCAGVTALVLSIFARLQLKE